MVLSALVERFSRTRYVHRLGPLGRVGHMVAMFVCGSVCLSGCLRHCETHIPGGHGDLWSNIAILIVVWDDTLLKEGVIFLRVGGCFLLQKWLKCMILDQHTVDNGRVSRER